MIEPTASTIRKRRDKTNPFDTALTLIAETAEDLCTLGGFKAEDARRIAELVVKGECLRYGGSQRYTPVWPYRGERDEAIKREFNGQNAGEICRKFNISRTSLYRIVGRRAHN